MLRVLIILLCVLGGVMLLLALALLALLNIRARLEFVGVSGDMTLDATPIARLASSMPFSTFMRSSLFSRTTTKN